MQSIKCKFRYSSHCSFVIQRNSSIRTVGKHISV